MPSGGGGHEQIDVRVSALRHVVRMHMLRCVGANIGAHVHGRSNHVVTAPHICCKYSDVCAAARVDDRIPCEGALCNVVNVVKHRKTTRNIYGSRAALLHIKRSRRK